MSEIRWKSGIFGLLKWILIYGGTYFVAPFLASLVYWCLAFFFPELNVTSDHLFMYFMLGMLAQTGLSFLLVYGLILRPRRESWDFVGFRTPQKNHLLVYGVLGGLLIFLVIIFFSVLLAYFHPQIEPQYFETLLTQEDQGMQIFFLLICASLLAPLVEEMLFRGVLYSWLRQYFNVFPAICLAGFVFGVVHFDAWRTLPLAFGGMALCWIYEKTRSVWVSMMAHGLWNAIMASLVLL